MYYPIQIPSILDKAFIEKIEYKENRYSQLENYIMCIWTMKSKEYLLKPVNNIILPDGCIDLIVDFTSKEIYFSGTSKATLDFPLSGKIDFIGIRIKPGVFYSVFKISCMKVMDTSIPYAQLETEYNLDPIFKLASTQNRIDFLKDYFITKVSTIEYDDFIRKINTIAQQEETKFVTELAKTFGYSTRQLNRIFKERCGVSVKVFLNILRLHYSLNLLLTDNPSKLIELAQASGFYDESHFIKEIKKYCKISPTDILKRYNMS